MTNSGNEFPPISETIESSSTGTQVRVKKIDVDVSAKHSLWFAWADSLSATPGPSGEGEESRPGFVQLDDDSEVDVEVQDASERWRHHPSPARESGANGLDGSDGTPVDARKLEVAEYQSDTYNSQFLLEPDDPIHLNKLVAVFSQDTPPTEKEPVTMQPVGAGPNTLTVPGGATRLYFGFHDGHEWNNNSGPSTSSDTIEFNVTVRKIL